MRRSIRRAWRPLILLVLLLGLGAVASLIMSDAGARRSGTTVTVTSKNATVVYVSFGSDSVVQVKDWTFCVALSAPRTCKFPLTGSRMLLTGGRYLNVSLAFGAPVGCGSTKAELNVNNPNWYDICDVSLVDGFSNKIQINYTAPGSKKPVALGPPAGAIGNEKILGVFPLGCDICVAVQKPSCGAKPGKDGCKAGTQYNPVPPCQYQGAVKGGGGAVEVIVL